LAGEAICARLSNNPRFRRKWLRSLIAAKRRMLSHPVLGGYLSSKPIAAAVPDSFASFLKRRSQHIPGGSQTMTTPC
jgi:hypothetical protein